MSTSVSDESGQLEHLIAEVEVGVVGIGRGHEAAQV